MKGLIIALLILAVIFVGYKLVRQLYIDTHCAMILGTMVCK